MAVSSDPFLELVELSILESPGRANGHAVFLCDATDDVSTVEVL
jgi:hypothetical protein